MSMEKDHDPLNLSKLDDHERGELLMLSSHFLSDNYLYCSLLASCHLFESPVEAPLLTYFCRLY